MKRLCVKRHQALPKVKKDKLQMYKPPQAPHLRPKFTVTTLSKVILSRSNGSLVNTPPISSPSCGAGVTCGTSSSPRIADSSAAVSEAGLEASLSTPLVSVSTGSAAVVTVCSVDGVGAGGGREVGSGGGLIVSSDSENEGAGGRIEGNISGHWHAQLQFATGCVGMGAGTGTVMTEGLGAPGMGKTIVSVSKD